MYLHKGLLEDLVQLSIEQRVQQKLQLQQDEVAWLRVNVWRDFKKVKIGVDYWRLGKLCAVGKDLGVGSGRVEDKAECELDLFFFCHSLTIRKGSPKT